MAFCSSCGNEISGHEAFCPFCETKLEPTIKRDQNIRMALGVMFIPFVLIGSFIAIGAVTTIILVLIQLMGR